MIINQIASGSSGSSSIGSIIYDASDNTIPTNGATLNGLDYSELAQLSSPTHLETLTYPVSSTRNFAVSSIVKIYDYYYCIGIYQGESGESYMWHGHLYRTQSLDGAWEQLDQIWTASNATYVKKPSDICLVDNIIYFIRFNSTSQVALCTVSFNSDNTYTFTQNVAYGSITSFTNESTNLEEKNLIYYSGAFYYYSNGAGTSTGPFLCIFSKTAFVGVCAINSYYYQGWYLDDEIGSLFQWGGYSTGGTVYPQLYQIPLSSLIGSTTTIGVTTYRQWQLNFMLTNRQWAATGKGMRIGNKFLLDCGANYAHSLCCVDLSATGTTVSYSRSAGNYQFHFNEFNHRWGYISVYSNNMFYANGAMFTGNVLYKVTANSVISTYLNELDTVSTGTILLDGLWYDTVRSDKTTSYNVGSNKYICIPNINNMNVVVS